MMSTTTLKEQTHMTSNDQSSEDFSRIEKAIRYLEENQEEQPRLEELASSVNLSPYHFQRLFRRWAGISPKRFLQFLTVQNAKRQLRLSQSVLDVSYATGLSGPGRLHDLFVNVEAVTPGEYKALGTGLDIDYGFHASPFGTCLVAVTRRGVCGLSFETPNGDGLSRLVRDWPRAVFRKDQTTTGPIVRRIFSEGSWDGGKLKLFLKGTNFQLQVWRALLRIPAGNLVSYQDIAGSVCTTAASRAVAGAVAANPVAFLIPCHRVIRKSGALGGYRWGQTRKKALIGWEQSRLV